MWGGHGHVAIHIHVVFNEVFHSEEEVVLGQY